MRATLISLGLFLLIIGCITKPQDERATHDMVENSDTSAVGSVVYDSSEAIWSYDYNQHTEQFEIKQLRPVDKDALTGKMVETIINKSWPKVQIEFIRTANDTAYISIPDSKVLTQQMGSAGAESFMISTTFSFTELKGIKHVSFAFEEGDHARPGIYDRNSWDRIKSK